MDGDIRRGGGRGARAHLLLLCAAVRVLAGHDDLGGAIPVVLQIKVGGAAPATHARSAGAARARFHATGGRARGAASRGWSGAGARQGWGPPWDVHPGAGALEVELLGAGRDEVVYLHVVLQPDHPDVVVPVVAWGAGGVQGRGGSVRGGDRCRLPNRTCRTESCGRHQGGAKPDEHSVGTAHLIELIQDELT